MIDIKSQLQTAVTFIDALLSAFVFSVEGNDDETKQAIADGLNSLSKARDSFNKAYERIRVDAKEEEAL